MQTFEIPDKDNDFHIIVKRPAELSPAILEQLVTKEQFNEFKQDQTMFYRQVIRKLSSIQELLEGIYQQDQQQVEATSPEPVEINDMEEPALIEVREDEMAEFMEGRSKVEMVEDIELHVEDSQVHEVFVHEVPRRARKPPLKKPKIEKIAMKRDYHGHQKMHFHDVESSREETVETIIEDNNSIDTTTGVYDTDVKIHCTFNGILIPVQTVNDLKLLSATLQEDPGKFREKLHEITKRSEGDFQRALSMLIADNVLFEVNWNGFKNKEKMSNMFIFSNLIYETWFSHIDFEEYINQVKTITKKAHKRYAKKVERQRHRSQGLTTVKTERDPVHEAIKTIVISDQKPH